MLDYKYDAETAGWNAARARVLCGRLEWLLKTEFRGLSGQVRVVDYPTGSVRIINLASLDETTCDRLVERADAVYRQAMSI